MNADRERENELRLRVAYMDAELRRSREARTAAGSGGRYVLGRLENTLREERDFAQKQLAALRMYRAREAYGLT